MTACKANRHAGLWAVLTTCTLLLAAPVWADGSGSAVVYYQVTYSDGDVRDLSEPPTTKEDIRWVMRIARYDTGRKGFELLSAGPGPQYAQVDLGKTIRRQLRWNGKAWVAKPLQHDQATTRRADRLRQLKQEEIASISKELSRQLGRLKDLQQAVVDAEKKLAQSKGSDAEAAAAARLKEARMALNKCLKSIEAFNRLLKALGGSAALESPSGQVEAGYISKLPTDGAGITKPITDRRILPHRVHVWKLPAGQGQRTYNVSMAHPEAGALGAFYYVAYADTDGDDRPDKLLAHSPVAQAPRPGAWTRWNFSTSEPVVFVGNAWPHADAAVYCLPSDQDPVNWRGLGTEVYVSGWLGGIPNRRWKHWPYLTNIHVKVANQNPD